jgi:5-methylcytosine-specific restriction endonuclease McrA
VVNVHWHIAFDAKVVEVGNEAFGAFFRMLSCAQRDFIKSDNALAIASTKTIRRLISAGLAVQHPNGLLLARPTDRSIGTLIEFERISWSRRNCNAVYQRDSRLCRYCGSIENLSIDHLIPRCQDGGDGVENLVVACRRCNSRKGGRTPEQAGMTLLPVPASGGV